jgi:hypothetical protein
MGATRGAENTMRADSIASLREALTQAGFDYPQSYAAPSIMAQRFRPNLQPAPTSWKFRLGRGPRLRGSMLRSVGAKMGLLSLVVVMSLLLVAAFLLGKKARTPSAPCYVETGGVVVALMDTRDS